MKRYAAIRKLTIMVLLSILGSYCVGAAEKDSTEQLSHVQVCAQTAYDKVYSLSLYCYKLCAELYGLVQKKIFGFEQNVKIQYQPSLRRSGKKSPQEQNDSFYLNSDKCTTDGKEDCLFNEKFFGDTYFGTGPENYDPVLSIDYTEYPIVVD